MDPRTTTMPVLVKRKRMSKTHPAPQWSVVNDMLHMRIKDAAAELDVPVSCLRRLCHQNGYRKWPGKMIRNMNTTGRILMFPPVDVPEGSPLAGSAAGPSQPAKMKEEVKELVTLNLIDKVGSSSAGSKRN